MNERDREIHEAMVTHLFRYEDDPAHQAPKQKAAKSGDNRSGRKYPKPSQSTHPEESPMNNTQESHSSTNSSPTVQITPTQESILAMQRMHENISKLASKEQLVKQAAVTAALTVGATLAAQALLFGAKWAYGKFTAPALPATS